MYTFCKQTLMCSQPLMIARRLFYAGQWITSSSRAYGYDDEMGELLLLSDPRTPPKWLSIISLGILFPFFVSWTIIGSFWFAEVVDDQTINYCVCDSRLLYYIYICPSSLRARILIIMMLYISVFR